MASSTTAVSDKKSTWKSKRVKLSSKVKSPLWLSIVQHVEGLEATQSDWVEAFVLSGYVSSHSSSLTVYVPDRMGMIRKALFGVSTIPVTNKVDLFSGEDNKETLSLPLRDWDDWKQSGYHGYAGEDELPKLSTKTKIPAEQLSKDGFVLRVKTKAEEIDFMDPALAQPGDETFGKRVVFRVEGYSWSDFPNKGEHGIGIRAVDLFLPTL